MSAQIIGVVGAGTMGGGIAETAVIRGFDVILYDVADEILGRAQERIQASLARQVERKRITAERADAALGRLRLTTRLDDLGAATLIVEAAPEDLALKRDLFARFDAIARPDTILASNTSSLSISRVAEATQHPERVVGMHFFNPAPVMPLVEVIPGQVTAPEVVAEVTAAARALGKTPVQARDTPGFIVNRIARPFYLEALELLGRGAASAEEIDRIMRLAGGFRMGPFELLDLIGLDVNLAVTRSIYEAFAEAPRFRPHPIQEQMVQAGVLGRKTGRGFYSYGKEEMVEGRPPAPPDPPRAGTPRRVAVLGEGALAEGFKAAARAAGWTVTAPPPDRSGDLPFRLEAHFTRVLDLVGKADAVVDFLLESWGLGLDPLAAALPPGSVWLSLMLETSPTRLAEEGPQWIFGEPLDVRGAAPESSRQLGLRRVVGFATVPPWQDRGLVELLADPLSSPDALSAAEALFRDLGKETARVKGAVGAVFPRIFAMIVNEAAFALGDGVASAADIDTALRLGANYPEGPLALADEIGLEVILEILMKLHRREPGERYAPAPFLHAMVEAGRTGRAAGRGFHDYQGRRG